jgi:hypothetical protein
MVVVFWQGSQRQNAFDPVITIAAFPGYTRVDRLAVELRQAVLAAHDSALRRLG